MTLEEVKLNTGTFKMVKSVKKEAPRRRSSMTLRPNHVTKATSRPTSAASNCLPPANIKVIVRVRPTNAREEGDNFRNVIKVVDDQMLVFDPKDTDQGFFFRGVQQKNRDFLKKTNKNLTFMFDRVFSETSTTDEVFYASTHSLIDNLMDGYNCSVFAYGATGAGKTFTMTGNEVCPGITFLTMTKLFEKQAELSNEREFELGITYLEVYNELVKDLLNPGPPLNLREDSNYGVTVAGIKMFKITKPDELFDLLVQGNKNRTQHPTDANAESSRSHAVFQVYIQMNMKGTKEVRRAKLSMIDLAGSERGSATNFTGARFTEGANINKSLLALGNCINSLADGHRHVPYRNSKLTRLLKDSLGGNCHTVMVANVSPSSLSFEDTYNTLKYATRVKKIKSEIKRNIITVETHTAQYVKMADDLKKENTNLKSRVAEQEEIIQNLQKKNDELNAKLKYLVVAQTTPGDSTEKNEEVLKMINKLIKKGLALVDQEFGLTIENHLKRSKRGFKEEDYHTIEHLCISPRKQTAMKKLDTVISRSRKQENNLQNEIDIVKKEKEAIMSKLDQLKEEHIELKGYIDTEQTKLLNKEINYRYESERKQVFLLIDRHEEYLSLLNRTATLLKSCYKQLHGHGFVSMSLSKAYEDIIAEIQGTKKVKFNCEIPDSGISSTTSIITAEEEGKTNNNKRKVDEISNDLDATFSILASSTPSKQKTKTCTVTKVRSPFPKKLTFGPVSPKSPKVRENLASRRQLRNFSNEKSPKVKGNPANALANRPRFRT